MEGEYGACKKGEEGGRSYADGGEAWVKASRPLIRVLVINDNSLWINDFI